MDNGERFWHKRTFQQSSAGVQSMARNLLKVNGSLGQPDWSDPKHEWAQQVNLVIASNEGNIPPFVYMIKTLGRKLFFRGKF